MGLHVTRWPDAAANPLSFYLLSVCSFAGCHTVADDATDMGLPYERGRSSQQGVDIEASSLAPSYIVIHLANPATHPCAVHLETLPFDWPMD